MPKPITKLKLHLNKQDLNGNLELNEAIKNNPKFAQELINRMPNFFDFNAKDKNGKTALEVAIETDNNEIVATLLETEKYSSKTIAEALMTVCNKEGKIFNEILIKLKIISNKECPLNEDEIKCIIGQSFALGLIFAHLIFKGYNFCKQVEKELEDKDTSTDNKNISFLNKNETGPVDFELLNNLLIKYNRKEEINNKILPDYYVCSDVAKHIM